MADVIVVISDGEALVVKVPAGQEVTVLDLDYDGDLHQVRLHGEPEGSSRWLCAGCLMEHRTAIVDHFDRSDDPDLVCEECGEPAVR